MYLTDSDKAVLEGANADLDFHAKVAAAWAQLHQLAHDKLGESEVPSQFTGANGLKLVTALEAAAPDATVKDMIAIGEAVMFPPKDEPAKAKGKPAPAKSGPEVNAGESQ